jgi:hypothetical protein
VFARRGTVCQSSLGVAEIGVLLLRVAIAVLDTDLDMLRIVAGVGWGWAVVVALERTVMVSAFREKNGKFVKVDLLCN